MTARRKAMWLFLLLLLLGILGVASTYTRLSQTADESYHLYCGMQWWQEGAYTHEPKHGPLQRVFEAALPYWLNAGETTAHMPPRDAYRYITVLMRLGSLPFYALSCLLVWRWSRELFGEAAALWSLALYVTLAPVSANAGLATTDMGSAAMLLWALWAGVRWLKNPTAVATLMLGAAGGLAVATKFSVVAQWPAGMALIVAAQAISTKRWPVGRRHIITLMLYALPVLLLALGLAYRFQFAPLAQGVRDLLAANRGGFALWMWGPLNNRGVWYFFPVVFFFKTPIPFHIAWVTGSGYALQQMHRGKPVAFTEKSITTIFGRAAPSPYPSPASGRGKRASRAGEGDRFFGNCDMEKLFPLLAALGVLLPPMAGNIDMGVRHVLAMYPLLAIPAGYGLRQLWHKRGWLRYAAASLLAWQAAGFMITWPDHVSYFNALAGAHPENISLDSDFDWNQDLILLDDALQRRHVDAVYVCLRDINMNRDMRSARLLLHALPMHCPAGPISGWIVVSGSERVLHPDNFAWLEGRQPIQRIGALDLYFIDTP